MPDSRKIHQDLENRFGRERMDIPLELLNERAAYRIEAGSALFEG